MNLTVSFLINNYNYGRFLRQAIDSALAQTYPHCEVVVVDDGSTDDSPGIIRSYGMKIHSIFKENGGQGSALNAGFAQTRGEIIKLLDSDDYLSPIAAERIVSAWHDGVHILHHRLLVVDINGKELGTFPGKNHTLDSGDLVPRLLRDGGYIGLPTSGLAYSRSLLQKLLPMPEAEFRICADGWLTYQAPFLAEVTVLDENLACYRHHDTNAWVNIADTSPKNLSREKVEMFVKHVDTFHNLIRKQARERGLEIATLNRWDSYEVIYFKLILYRLGSDLVKDQYGSMLIRKLIKKIRLSGFTRSEAVRKFFWALTIWLSPRIVLRQMYPKMF